MNQVQISAKDVQELRRRTGAGMMDCKNALLATGGDMEKAIEYLRKQGIAKSEQRAGRVASEGRLVLRVTGDRAVAALLELNCETDFVSRNADFGAVAESLAEELLRFEELDGVASGEAGRFLQQPVAAQGGKTVSDVVAETAARTGERVVLRRYARLASEGTLGTYLHFNGRIGVIVDIAGPRGEAAEELGKRVAEHIAGSPTPPEAVRREEVPMALVERERRIAEEKARAEGKPENIIPKVVEGVVRKYYERVTLLHQPWIRDESRTIQSLVEEFSRQAGAPLEIRRFVRFRMGEE
jgi:elongation factor Ts